MPETNEAPPTDIIASATYVSLFHGRTDISVDMHDWGTEGPTLGPFSVVRMTYRGALMLFPWGPNQLEYWLPFFSDLWCYDGVFYGDIDMCSGAELNNRKLGGVENFDPAKAILPAAFRVHNEL